MDGMARFPNEAVVKIVSRSTINALPAQCVCSTVLTSIGVSRKTINRVGITIKKTRMKNEKKQVPVKKFSLDDFKTQAKTISSVELLETITGGVEDACHIPPLKPSGNGGGAGSTGPL